MENLEKVNLNDLRRFVEKNGIIFLDYNIDYEFVCYNILKNSILDIKNVCKKYNYSFRKYEKNGNLKVVVKLKF